MYRPTTCGELRLTNAGQTVTLAGWVQRTRKMGGMTFVDLRDRYGITQLVFNEEKDSALCAEANKLGREYVIQIVGEVSERSSKNKNLPTGEIEITVNKLTVLNASLTPPFTIEENTDGGDDLRMKYRYLDLRRSNVRANLELRHKMTMEIRRYLDKMGFLEIETPMLIGSTPEGARDFVVPSRVNPGQFYALPQSPQTLKQLLMVAGMDRYFQIVKCFRDEDLRADRQPEFTQIDCEMSFVQQDDVTELFEGFIKNLFVKVKNINFTEKFPQITYQEAMEKYGNDKPDIRFSMIINNITDIAKGKNFPVFDNAEYIGGIVLENAADYTRKQIDSLTDFVKMPQNGATGLIYIKYNPDGSLKSSVDKFFDEDSLLKIAEKMQAPKNSMILILAGDKKRTLHALSELRLKLGNDMGLRSKDVYAPLWVVEFPLLEWDAETKRFYAIHQPFTSPFDEDIPLFDTDPGKIRAKAYDCVINGVEVGGG